MPLITRFDGDHQNPLSLSDFTIKPATLADDGYSTITPKLSKTFTQG